MKKSIIALVAICMMLGATAKSPATHASVTSKAGIANHEWMKSADGTWMGMKEGKAYWYKLDKSAKLWWSADGGKTWAAVQDGMWADKNGKWLKIVKNNLMWTADGGKTWAAVPEWKWEGPKGEWYKFDKDWSLWTNGKL